MNKKVACTGPTTMELVKHITTEVESLLAGLSKESKTLVLEHLDSYIQGALADLEDLPKTEKP